MKTVIAFLLFIMNFQKVLKEERVMYGLTATAIVAEEDDHREMRFSRL
jgi:hypothetical protein